MVESSRSHSALFVFLSCWLKSELKFKILIKILFPFQSHKIPFEHSYNVGLIIQYVAVLQNIFKPSEKVFLKILKLLIYLCKKVLCLSPYHSVCLSVCSSVCLSDCMSVCVSMCLYVCLSVCQSVCLSSRLGKDGWTQQHGITWGSQTWQHLKKKTLSEWSVSGSCS